MDKTNQRITICNGLCGRRTGKGLTWRYPGLNSDRVIGMHAAGAHANDKARN
jgi:hypothetical protein